MHISFALSNENMKAPAAERGNGCGGHLIQEVLMASDVYRITTLLFETRQKLTKQADFQLIPCMLFPGLCISL